MVRENFLAADERLTSDLKTTYVSSLNCWSVCVSTMKALILNDLVTVRTKRKSSAAMERMKGYGGKNKQMKLIRSTRTYVFFKGNVFVNLWRDLHSEQGLSWFQWYTTQESATPLNMKIDFVRWQRHQPNQEEAHRYRGM